MASTKTPLTFNESHRVLMAPSILSAEFLNLESSVNLIDADADLIHVDVMDGHFVPNLTIGPGVAKRLHERFSTPLDVHLMVSNPEATADWYLDAGAGVVCAHVEALVHAHRFLGHVRERGAAAGIALNPGTPVSAVRDLVEYADLVLLMSVNPGFGGQSFIESTPRRVAELSDLCRNLGCSPLIEVDGGIGTGTAPCVCAAGATVLVAGSAVFGKPDPAVAMAQIRTAGEGALA
jgi:ribulose-phosphate 3-epimerase